MAHKEDKATIFQLLDKGITIGEIEKTTKVARRTLYRWYAEWRSIQSKQSNKEQQPIIISEVVQKTKQLTESQLEIDFAENWLSIASKQSIKHCIINGQIAKALSNILINEIQQKDINYRALSALSSSIAIHSKLHRDYGQFHLLDGNKAIEMLTSQGYIISEIVRD